MYALYRCREQTTHRIKPDNLINNLAITAQGSRACGSAMAAVSIKFLYEDIASGNCRFPRTIRCIKTVIKPFIVLVSVTFFV
jgi:hypothetical protein